MHLDSPITGHVTDIYDDGPDNDILRIEFADKTKVPDHCPVGTVSSRRFKNPDKIHVGSKVLVTDVTNIHPPGVLHITGISEP